MFLTLEFFYVSENNKNEIFTQMKISCIKLNLPMVLDWSIQHIRFQQEAIVKRISRGQDLLLLIDRSTHIVIWIYRFLC